jgi:hypothetical protein
MPLAWSLQDKIACVADVDNDADTGSHGEVRFFDLKAGSELLELSTLGGFCKDDISANNVASCTALREGYGYGVSEATAAPREFSPSGRWFAFTRAIGDSAYLYWADLEASPVEISRPLFWYQAGAPERLAFSPDSQKVAVQIGTTLLIQTLSGASSALQVTSKLTMRERCSEEMPTAPNQYCGNTSLDARFKWAPNSRAVAYPAGTSLAVVDVSDPAFVTTFPLPAPLCEQPLCSGDFEFQP